MFGPLWGVLLVLGMPLWAEALKKTLLPQARWFAALLALISSPPANVHSSELNTTCLLSGQGFKALSSRQISQCYMRVIVLLPATCSLNTFNKKLVEVTFPPRWGRGGEVSSRRLIQPQWPEHRSQSSPYVFTLGGSMDLLCVCVCVFLFVRVWVCVFQGTVKSVF